MVMILLGSGSSSGSGNGVDAGVFLANVPSICVMESNICRQTESHEYMLFILRFFRKDNAACSGVGQR